MSNFFSELSQAYLIAEIGVNHNGDIDLARRLITEAKRAGADAAKFQTFVARTLVTRGTPKVKYQEVTTSPGETHYEMIRKLELGRQEHQDLKALCAEMEMDFLSTPYDIDSARFLCDLGVRMFKTASADLIDLPLQRFIASTGKPAIVSTGMASLGEIEEVVNIFETAGNPDLILLHCVSNYPCSDASLNLTAMNTLSRAFDLPVGYSDHSEGFLAAVAAVSLGARVIEKHFTIDKNLPGPDHKASSTPEEFAELAVSVRRVERMLGSPRKMCQPEERQMAEVSRKSLVLSRAMRAGEVLTSADLQLMRPGTGIPAAFISRIEGLRIRTDLEAFHQLRWNDLDQS